MDVRSKQASLSHVSRSSVLKVNQPEQHSHTAALISSLSALPWFSSDTSLNWKMSVIRKWFYLVINLLWLNTTYYFQVIRQLKYLQYFRLILFEPTQNSINVLKKSRLTYQWWNFNWTRQRINIYPIDLNVKLRPPSATSCNGIMLLKGALKNEVYGDFIYFFTNLIESSSHR